MSETPQKTSEEIRQQQTYQLAAKNLEFEVALTLARQRIAELEAQLDTKATV